jgi:cell division protein FtsQ
MAGSAVAALVTLALRLDAAQLEAWMPVEFIRVEGDIWHLDASEFRAALGPHVAGGYFLVNLTEIEAAARTFAWIDQVRVTRVWPDTILVQIKEHQPVARWGEDSLLNGRGERFTPNQTASFERLPSLSGPVGQEKQVLNMMRALNGKLQARQLRVESLRLSKRLAWVAQLDGGTEIVFGNQDPLAAMDRLLALLPKLGEERIAAIQKVDLRYPNGFSLILKPESQTPPQALSSLRNPLSPDSTRAQTGPRLVKQFM